MGLSIFFTFVKIKIVGAVFHSFVDNKLFLTKGPTSSSGFLIPVKLSEYAPNIIEKKIPFKILESGISFSNE